MLACARVMLLHVSSVEIKCLPCKQRMVIVRAEFGSKQSHEIGHRVDKLCQVFINMFSTCFFFQGSRWALICNLCRVRTGACIQCSVGRDFSVEFQF